MLVDDVVGALDVGLGECGCVVVTGCGTVVDVVVVGVDEVVVVVV